MPSSKILIADDNQPNVELLEAYLAEVDCEIAVAADGHETLEKVAEFKPDLILLDIMMPKLSGFEVCRMLRKNPATSHIMILMVTALGEPGDIERAVAAAATTSSASRSTSWNCSSGWRTCSNLRHVTDELERLRRYIDEMEARPAEAKAGGVSNRARARKAHHGVPQEMRWPSSWIATRAFPG